MSFGAYVLLAFGFLAIAFIWVLASNAKQAGKDAERARQGKAASEARRDAQKAESSVDGMSDNDALDRLRDNWSRD